MSIHTMFDKLSTWVLLYLFLFREIPTMHYVFAIQNRIVLPK